MQVTLYKLFSDCIKVLMSQMLYLHFNYRFIIATCIGIVKNLVLHAIASKQHAYIPYTSTIKSN